MPFFFVPRVDPADFETTLAEMADLCGVTAPDPDKRVQSITFKHNGESWTAEVGQTLRGERTDRRRRGGKLVDVTSRLSDPATVLAIFPGDPTMVVTDARPITELVSAWENPFMVGWHAVSACKRFDPPAAS